MTEETNSFAIVQQGNNLFVTDDPEICQYKRREPKKKDTQNQMEILAESLFDMASFYSDTDHPFAKYARGMVLVAEAAKNAAQGKQWMGEHDWR